MTAGVGKRVLVVDDEPVLVSLLTEILEGEGYLVDAAATAAEAIDRIRDRIYDVAIFDFNLPDMNGVMLHRALRHLDPELASRTLFISGVSQTTDHLGYYGSKGAGFLAKPFRPERILEAVRSALEGGEASS